jgi:PAS domain S-box-containing protein
MWLAPVAARHGAAIATVESSWSERLTDPRGVEILAGLHTRSCLVAPIVGTGGEPVGSIVLGAVRRDRFEADDLALARDLAGRVGVAAGQARLFGAVDRFKATVDASADAVYMFDPETLRLTYINRGGADLVGQDPATLLGASVLRLQPDENVETFGARLRALRSSPDLSVTYTSVLARGDRSEIPVEAFLQEVTLPDGGTTAILTARDVSERIDVQAQLTRIAGDERRQAAELRAVIQAMGEGILVVDPDGRVSLANDAAADLLPVLPDTLDELAATLGLPGPEALGLDEPDRPSQPPDDEAGGTAEPRAVNLPDGRWIEVATYPADLGGGVTGGGRPSRIVVVRDVTRARDAEAAREAFLGVLSHELRTPVTTIFGYAKVLQRSVRREDRNEMLADIEVEADRLYRIVEDLLALSRVEGGITIEGEPLLIQHLAGPVVTSEAQRWNRVRFETDLPSGLPAVFGERTYVEQVLRNLVSNAGKYSPPGSEVTVSASATPSEVLVRVLDRGPGIETDESERLFDLYYRSPATARGAAGAGIGLYVGRGLITAMGGRIWAKARPGGGSEFGFSLPRCHEDPIPAGAASRDGGETRGVG